jgi:hypothetical protein
MISLALNTKTFIYYPLREKAHCEKALCGIIVNDVANCIITVDCGVKRLVADCARANARPARQWASLANAII